MKKFVVACLPVLLCANSFGQTLFTYGKNVVTKNEFVTAFNKNPNVNGNRKQALKEYLDLYINFKLKVQAAYDAKLQNDATQIAELSNFKVQIADNIINEEARIGQLVQEAFNRSQKDIHLAQVFVEIPDNGDTSSAYKKIHQAYADLQAGKDFANVSSTYSTDITTKNTGGDMGYITVFTLPYFFENAAYNLQAGSYSAPFRSKIGYHIFKNVEERKPLGTRKMAQILIAVPPNSSDAERQAAGRKADSVYQLLKKGRNFGELARTVSNDIASANSDGMLQEFGIGTYDPRFEKVAFGLTEPGQISEPFETGFGFHILQMVQAVPVGADASNVETVAALQEKVLRDDRMVQAKREMIEKQMKLIGFKPAPIAQATIWAYTDSAMANKKNTASKITGTTSLFSFAKQNVTAQDWVDYVKANLASASQQTFSKSYGVLWDDFKKSTAADYYRTHLEEYSPAYKQQVQEFKDANLLFGVMDTNVWSKANNDTAGLRSYYNTHKAKYVWQPSADALVITCNNQSMVDELQARLQRNPADWKTIVDSYGTQATADSARYELGQLPVVDRTNFTDNLITAPVKNDADNSVTFNYIFAVHKGGEPRSFDDSKGMVISDYQQVLEDKWIAELKKKYPVKVNMEVFNSIK